MTIRTRLFLWFLPILAISVGAIILFSYGNDHYAFIPRKNEFAFLLISIFALTIVMIAIVGIAAHKISKPVQELNSAALTIAAGDYGKTIEVDGPREIRELSQTLSTLSQSLEEQIFRLRESSLARERLYGEYECSLLLQHHMLQKAVDEFLSKTFSARLIKVTSSTELSGYLFDIEEDRGSFFITVGEAKEKGFKGMYDLLYNRKDLEELKYPFTSAEINHHKFRSLSKRMTPPIIWTMRRNSLEMSEGKEISLEPGDFIFFYNKGFAKQFQRHQLIQSWFGKVLRHFAAESFDSFATVLTNELNFLANKQHIADDMYILCFRVDR